MNRVIRFRGKRKDSKEWVYGDLHTLCGHIHIHVTPFDKYNIDRATVGQFTGLKDKNGRDIYEGDILRSDTYPYSDGEVKDNYYAVVWWSDDNAAFAATTRISVHSDLRGVSNGNCEYLGELLEVYNSAFEVIGNIYDNPELLRP